MPYVPPPRPPPAPRPPVFRPPPGPNIHQQQVRRVQQQQQQLRQQQQIRQFHQTQQQLVANQTRMQMDRNRQQQQMLQQQQLQRQQQDNFRRQQQLHHDNLRRQQDQIRHQQQLQQTQQDQLRRQRQLLQGLQSSSCTTGASVFISPAFTLEISGLETPADGGEGVNLTTEDLGGLAPNMGGLPQGNFPTDQFPPTAPLSTSLPPQQATPIAQASPTNIPGSAYPPSYPTHPSSVPIQSPFSQQAQPLLPNFDPLLPPPEINGGAPTPQINEPNLYPPSNGAAVPPQKSPEPAKNQIVLNDGTCIVIRSRDDFVFAGPQGQQMIVNCLPLFVPRPEAQRVEPTTSGHAASVSGEAVETQHTQGHSVRKTRVENQGHKGSKSTQGFALKKASSSESVLVDTCASAAAATKCKLEKRSSEAEDILDESARNKVKVHRETWTQFNKGYSTTGDVESASQVVTVSETTTEKLVEALSSKEGGREEGEKEMEGVDSREEQNTSGEGGGRGEGGGNEEGTSTEEGEREGNQGGPHVQSDGESDGDNGKELSISYIENLEQIQTLKRSSGSVSFMVNPLVRVTSMHSPRPASVVESRGEEAGEVGGTDWDEGTRGGEGGEVSESGERGEEGEGVNGRSEGEGGEGGKGEDGGRGREGVNGGGEVATEDKTWGGEDGEEVRAKIQATGEEPHPTGPQTETQPLTSSAGDTASTETPQAQSTLLETAGESSTLPSENSSRPSAPTSDPGLSQRSEQLLAPTATPLPPPPLTVKPAFIERSGWLTKLSHRRGVFGDKWQKRYFVLHCSWIYYFKKYGDATPRGAIRLHPGAWVKSVSQGTSRQSDAVVNTPPNALISVVRCFGVHKPDNFAASLSSLLSQDGVAEAFRSQTISVSNSDSCSRTFYMIAPSNEERDGWVDAIRTNIKAHALSPAAMETSCQELHNMLRAVGSSLTSIDLPALLSLLHSRTRDLHHHGNN